MRPLVIGTRASSLALCQTAIVQTRLEELAPDGAFRIQKIKAQADQDPELPLATLGGEGVFVKELEAALAGRRIDLAVHSMKDLPLDLGRGLTVGAVLEREEPRDALVSRDGQGFGELPPGSRIGTSSLRRRSQLLAKRRDLEMLEIRGNVDTRLRKLDEGRYDAIVIAACGLIRLGLESRITEFLSLDIMVPEPGQGALAVEARADDREVLALLGRLDDPLSRACVDAERAFLRALGGGCRVPIAAYAAHESGMLRLLGIVAAPDGSADVRGSASAAMTEPVALGERLAAELASKGAKELLAAA